MGSPEYQKEANTIVNTSENGLLPSFAKDSELTEKKRQQIVNAACKLFFRKGFHGTTIREIATAASMSMGQLYHYISSKDDVLFLIYRHMQTLWREHLAQCGIEDIHDPVERLREALRQTIAFMVKNRELLLFIYTETKYLDKRHLGAVLEMDNQEVVGFWRKILQGIETKEPIRGDIDLLANLVSYLMVFPPMRGWNMKNIPQEKITKGLIDFILMGLGFKV